MATLEVIFTHPSISFTRTLTVSDAKLVEFADLLIADYDEDPALSRVEATTKFADGMLQAAKDRYRKMKYDTDVSAVSTVEIDG